MLFLFLYPLTSAFTAEKNQGTVLEELPERQVILKKGKLLYSDKALFKIENVLYFEKEIVETSQVLKEGRCFFKRSFIGEFLKYIESEEDVKNELRLWDIDLEDETMSSDNFKYLKWIKLIYFYKLRHHYERNVLAQYTFEHFVNLLNNRKNNFPAANSLKGKYKKLCAQKRRLSEKQFKDLFLEFRFRMSFIDYIKGKLPKNFFENNYFAFEVLDDYLSQLDNKQETKNSELQRFFSQLAYSLSIKIEHKLLL